MPWAWWGGPNSARRTRWHGIAAALYEEFPKRLRVVVWHDGPSRRSWPSGFSLYLTRGEAGITGKSHAEAAAVRTAEVEKACRVLGAHLVFAGQIDGASEVTNQRCNDFRKILESLAPDVVFTHWPVDTRRDHRATCLLVFDAWLESRKRFALYYFEVMTGEQTSQFWPTHYVDITATEARKRAACYAHLSQNPDDFYGVHDKMNHFRVWDVAP